MKTISLEEARQAATPGKLYVHQCPNTKRQFLCVVGLDNNVAEVFDHVGKPKANAALLAHRWNTHDELVEALEKAIELASMEDDDYYKADDAGEVERVKAVLARAKTVDMP